MNTEPITLTQGELKRLLGAANGDAALLYLYLQGGNRLEMAGKDLNMNESRLGFATAVLRQLGLVPKQMPAKISW